MLLKRAFGVRLILYTTIYAVVCLYGSGLLACADELCFYDPSFVCRTDRTTTIDGYLISYSRIGQENRNIARICFIAFVSSVAIDLESIVAYSVSIHHDIARISKHDSLHVGFEISRKILFERSMSSDRKVSTLIVGFVTSMMERTSFQVPKMIDAESLTHYRQICRREIYDRNHGSCFWEDIIFVFILILCR